MTRRLLATYVTITAVALLVLVVPLGLTFARSERDRLYFDIERDAAAIASLAEDDLEEGTTPDLDEVLEEYSETTTGRIVIVDREGVSVADSDDLDAPPEDYSTRPEIAEALEGDRAVGTRRSDTLDTGLVYVAIPVASGGTVHGAVRITFPTASLDARVRSAWVRLGGLSVLVLAVVTVVGLVLARSVTRPVKALDAAADQIARGQLTVRVDADQGPPELQRLGATFNRTAERLEQLIGAQERFVADAAHQLRSPLTAVRLRLENLEPHLPATELPKLEATLDEVTRLSRIVDGLLVLARHDAERPPLVAVDVADIATSRLMAWSETASNNGVALDGRCDGPLVAMAPDAALEQVLDNLISNALAAAPPGSHVTVSAIRREDTIELHVVDEGAGLDAEDRARAFERFWRGSTQAAGSGLGLSIVRELVRLAGGESSLESGPGGVGVDAVVRLPAAASLPSVGEDATSLTLP